MNDHEILAAICDDYNLQRAWMEVRGGRTLAARHQGAGVDGVTVADWEAAWQENLRALKLALLAGSYRPNPLLWFDLQRGNGRQLRRLGIPTVTDRVAQRAVKNVLEPTWEQLFLSCSHGFRPDRSVFSAIAQVLWHQARGRHWVVDADIESYFDHVSHDRLLDQLAELGGRRIVALVAAWLQVGETTPGRGVAQGSVISPLLSNIYLHPFDVAMIEAGVALVRYADDFVALCDSRQEARDTLDYVSQVLAELGLALNHDKTRIVRFGPEFAFLGARFSET